MFYRLVEKCYRPRIKRDEGSGSMIDVVHDETQYPLREWEETDETTEESVIAYVTQRWFPPRDPLDPCEDYEQYDSDIECSYWLQRRKDTSEKWRLVKVF